MLFRTEDSLTARPKAAMGGQMDVRTMAFLVLALLCATVPLELSQLTFALAGAVAYAAIQAVTPRRPPFRQVPCKDAPSAHRPMVSTQQRCGKLAYPAACPASPSRSPPRAAAPQKGLIAAPKQEFRQPSLHPVARPTFKATEWDAEVDELIGQIAPSHQSERMVQQLAAAVQQELGPLIPELRVAGYATSDLVRGTAFAVAVPEVDIVASVSEEILAVRVQGRLCNRGSPSEAGPVQLDTRKLQKSAIRYCTDRLVGSGHFKFRRSAFRGAEPKVTLLASPAPDLQSPAAIPMNFSVNSSTPANNAALLAECGRLDQRARDLILLVRRWAKDRGICHAAKGHLSPYAWALLAVYFLQVRPQGALLPPLEGCALVAPSGAASSKPAAPLDAQAGGTSLGEDERGSSQLTVGALFKEFVHFYAVDFDARREVVCVLRGQRVPPSPQQPVRCLALGGGEDRASCHAVPRVEDPLSAGHDLGEGTTVFTLARFAEEFARALRVCEGGGSLATLLEPWTPPERASGADEQD